MSTNTLSTTSTPAAEPATTSSAAPASVSLADMAAGAKSDRNRAVDLYRAVAMLAVAFGHWAAIAIGTDEDGELYAGNLLEFSPNMSWVTWLLQVMPLFFVVGGFSSAMSLDKHMQGTRKGNDDIAGPSSAPLPLTPAPPTGRSGPADTGARPQDWVVARLRRMVAPTFLLAVTWLAILGAGAAAGQWELVILGATSASIPLWFLSNYTIDTAIAPYVLPRFRRNPARFALLGGAAFLSLEALRFADVDGPLSHLPTINWVLGWLLFQVAGFAWRDGLLPTGRKLGAASVALWVAAITAVTLGPWPVAMVHFPGLENSPTHPPSLALMLFGAAYSSTALLFAPAVSRFLARSPRAWAAVVAANATALSVYLWHFTAAVGASAIMYGFGWLPTAEVGTGAWWIQKLPLVGLSIVILGGIVALVSGHERKALLAPRCGFKGGQLAMLATAGGLSIAVKLWANGSAYEAVAGMAVVAVIWVTMLRAPKSVVSAT